jgi:predicted AAA+ superfamily ATPase
MNLQKQNESNVTLERYYDRTLTRFIQQATETFLAVLITGPRQVGKTTILKKCLESNRIFVSLDNPKIRKLAQEDPDLFFQTFHPPMLIDEIQYAPELFPYIKMIADSESQKGLFWMTGSQQFHLMKNVTESLAGRVAIFNLQGLSQAEKLRQQSVPFSPDDMSQPKCLLDSIQIYEMIIKGSFPALFSQKETNTEAFYSSYLQTYLERDVRELVNISNLRDFVKFMEVVAARTGQLLNYSDIAKDIGISLNTAKSWLSILEASGIIYFLHPYFNNLTSRAIKTPKMYFLDTGLCCYISGWNSANTLEKSAVSGAMLETYAISEIIKSFWHNGRRAPIFFYRDKEKKEIDVIIETNGLLNPIEIKKTATPTLRDASNFSTINDFNVGKKAILCLAKEKLPLTRDISIIPICSL